jgi:hypothetical protein
MLQLIVMAFTGTFTGLVGGGMAAGYEGMLVGGSLGLMLGAFAWATMSTVAQIRRERRLNRYFNQQDFWGE